MLLRRVHNVGFSRETAHIIIILPQKHSCHYCLLTAMISITEQTLISINLINDKWKQGEIVTYANGFFSAFSLIGFFDTKITYRSTLVKFHKEDQWPVCEIEDIVSCSLQAIYTALLAHCEYFLFSLYRNVFKCHLSQICQNASECGKGLSVYDPVTAHHVFLWWACQNRQMIHVHPFVLTPSHIQQIWSKRFWKRFFKSMNNLYKWKLNY